jgi:hypothetical protein
VAFVLVIAGLVVYASTVYTQQLWGREYGKLKKLQRSERQLVAASEVLRNHIANQADQPGSGLIPNTMANAIFLQAEPLRHTNVADPVLPNFQPQAVTTPLGY